MTIINVVSIDDPPETWRRQEPDGLSSKFLYSEQPLASCDVHVVMGVTGQVIFPDTRAMAVFVATEPPEIRKYDIEVLSKYSLVTGPKFEYLTNLENFVPLSGLLPWKVGVPEDSKKPAPSQPWKTLCEVGNAPPIVTTVTSNKAITPQQRQRIEFVEFLKSNLSEFEVYGRGFRPIADKAEAIGRGAFHLAMENSNHAGYWSEKLADPILLGSFPLYVGTPTVLDEFNPNGLQLLDLSDRKKSLGIIKGLLSNELSEENIGAMRENRTLLLQSHNFHSRIETLLSSIQCDNPARQGSVFPPHRRNKYLTDEGKPKPPRLSTKVKRVLGHLISKE